MFLRLDGFTKEERIQMTARVNEAINQAGAWITNFHQYSNVLICINFEVPSANLKKLASTLQQTAYNSLLLLMTRRWKRKNYSERCKSHLYTMNQICTEKYLPFRDKKYLNYSKMLREFDCNLLINRIPTCNLTFKL